MRRLYKELFKSWFGLTGDEQRAVLAILGLFLLGLAVRTWRCLL